MIDKITLKAARVNAGLYQKDVCDKMEITIPTIIRWERGQTMPSPSQRMFLASLYGIDEADIDFNYKEASV